MSSGDADGGQTTEHPERTSSGAEKMTQAAAEAIRDKRARRALGKRFSDGRVSGIEPLPVFEDPRRAWELRRY